MHSEICCKCLLHSPREAIPPWSCATEQWEAMAFHLIKRHKKKKKVQMAVELRFPQRRVKTFPPSFTFPTFVTFPTFGVENAFLWVVFSKPISHFKQNSLLHEPHLHLHAQKPHTRHKNTENLPSCMHRGYIPTVLLLFCPIAENK